VVRTLEGLPTVGLVEDDRRDAEAVANEVLTEVTQPSPDRTKIRRALSSLKGLLAPVATGLVTGTAAGAQEWAKTGGRAARCRILTTSNRTPAVQRRAAAVTGECHDDPGRT
jgi:hypothetical protein